MEITDGEAAADTVIMLSAELIEQVMQEYFNKKMFKQQVCITESKATEAGYAFTLAFVTADKQQQQKESLEASRNADTVQRASWQVTDEYIKNNGRTYAGKVGKFEQGDINLTRDSKGRFVKR